jgi:hypothetical protein
MAQKENYKPTKGTVGQLIETILEHAQSTGIQIVVQNVSAKNGRPDGLLVFFGDLAYDADQGIHARELPVLEHVK